MRRQAAIMTLSRRRALARDARGQVEAALDRIGWRWSRRLSLWLDALLVLEEGE